jgi:hypothetical protein
MRYFGQEYGRMLSSFGSNLKDGLQTPGVVLAMDCHLACTDQRIYRLGHQ